MRQLLVAAALAVAACSAAAMEWQVPTASANSAHPTWCGTHIAFESDRDTPGNFQIWGTNDTGESRSWRITNQPWMTYTRPHWNCAQRYLAFQGVQGSGPDSIYTVYDIGPPTFVPIRVPQASGDNESPSYLAGKIAFHSDRAGQRDVYLMSEGGEQNWVTRLTTNAADDVDPAISPNGELIAFSSGRAGDADIWITSTAGEQDLLERVTATAERDAEPAWSPGGTHLAFARGGVGIVVVSVDTRTEHVVTTNGTDSSPAWSPDGDRIAFTRHGSYDQIWCSDNVPPGAPVETASWGCVKALFR
jgi:TolB protein